MNCSNPDKKSIIMYVMCLFQTLPHSIDPNLVPATPEQEKSQPQVRIHIIVMSPPISNEFFQISRLFFKFNYLY